MKNKSAWEDIVLYAICVAVVGLFSFFFHENIKRSDYNPEHYDHLLEKLAFDDNVLDTDATNYYRAQLLLNHKRYEAVMVSLRNRFLLRTVTFLLGSLIVVLGAIVVIRGVRDGGNDIDIGISEKLKVKFKSSTPGLVLALFGTLIILTALISEKKLVTEDGGIAPLKSQVQLSQPIFSRSIASGEKPDSDTTSYNH